MRLSDIGFDRYDEVMAKVPELIENLAKNKEFHDMMYRDDLPKDITDPENRVAAEKLMARRVSEHFPKLLTNAKKELIAYFALLENVSEEEFAKTLTVGKMVDGINGMLRDTAFMNFFALYQTDSTE